MSDQDAYKMREVTTQEFENLFITVPLNIYKDDKNYIRPLDMDIEKVFDPKQNSFFSHGECTRWILFKNDIPIGRVAAFYDKNKAFTEKQPTGGMGFFECPNDDIAAKYLFDTCKQWLQTHGMEAMDGPINFGERDNWWGLLVDGFLPPTYGMNYNPPYYKTLFENYGFQTYFKQYVFRRSMMEAPSERMVKKAELTLNDPRYSYRHMDRKHLDKYTEDFRIIYNAGWADFFNQPTMSVEESRHIMKSLKPILIDELLWFGYYDDKPISFYIMIPDVNQIIKDFDGQLNLFNKLRFVYRQWRGVKKVIGVIFGVVPEHHSKGVDNAMIVSAGKVLLPKKFYTEIEMNWIGDFNPKMVNMVRNIDGRMLRTYITYRKLFDPTKPFERHPVI